MGTRRAGLITLTTTVVAALIAVPAAAGPEAPLAPSRALVQQAPPEEVDPVDDVPDEMDEGPAVVVDVPERVHEDQRAAAAEDDVQPAATRTPKPVDRPRERISGYTESSRDLQPVPHGWRPYQTGRVRPVPFGLVDTTGVRVFKADWDGKIYDHPVAQAQYGLHAMESYRMSGQRQYLDVAIKNAQRIIDRRHVIDGAWYFPYDFDFDLYRNGKGVLTAPWSSGMSSGQALSLFCRLYDATGDQKWLDAADATFAAFLQAPDGVGYFSSFVDTAGRLWLEEYSRYPVMDSERVLNGHMWSMFGLWDYWMSNGQDHPKAESLFKGALYTIEKTAMNGGFRNPGWYSRYSLCQKNIAPTYHQHHQDQFLWLHRMTHDTVWITRASTYRADHPEWRNTTGFAVITPKTQIAYRLDDKAVHPKDRTMKVLQSKKVKITKTTGAAFDRRGKIPGGPNVIRLSAGWLKGWWIPEGYGKAYSRDLLENHAYRPEAQLYVDRDVTLAVYQYANGKQTAGKLVTLRAGTHYPADRSAFTFGRTSWHISRGPLAGWWLPTQAVVKVYRMPGWL